MLDLINILDYATGSDMCTQLEPVLKIVGLVVFGIKVAVPIILIVIGMFDLAKAVTEKKEDDIKAAQQKLIKKAIAAVLVFLVITFVGWLMTLIGSTEYKDCMKCINNPFDCSIDLSETVG